MRLRVTNGVQVTGFSPNELARRLKQKESPTIKLVVADLNPFQATVVRAFVVKVLQLLRPSGASEIRVRADRRGIDGALFHASETDKCSGMVRDTAEQNDLNVIVFTTDDSESREREVQSAHELGVRACEVLVQALDGCGPQHVRLEVPFLPRSFTAPP
ncbi:hypothetical protein GCM10022631_02540 [Deinococcus rubellus]